MSAKMWVWILFGCSLCIQVVVAAADDIEGESLTQSQSLPSFVHQI